jgi:hypothetical protein
VQVGVVAPGRLTAAWMRARPDVVYVPTQGPLGWAAAGAATRLGIPVVSGFHTNFDVYAGHYRVGVLRRAIAAPGLTGTDQLLLVFTAKLANPAYARWRRLSLGQQPYQAFDEEALLKELRSRIAASVAPPPGAQVTSVPIVPGAVPVIDGRLAPGEWQAAVQADLGKGTTLYAMSDGRRLYVAADVPGDTTEDGFDQLRVYYHVDLAGVITHERVHVSRWATDAFASYRLSHLPRPGERQALALSESHIYRQGRGASTMIGHRQFELALDLDESGLHPGVPFAAYVEVETDPLTDWGGRFRERAYAGRLGSQTAPVWLVIGTRWGTRWGTRGRP